MKTLISLLTFYLLLSFSIVFADYYKYVDDEGNVHFTDDPYNVPLDKMTDVKIYKAQKTVETPKKAPAPLPKKTIADGGEAEFSEEPKEVDRAEAVSSETTTAGQAEAESSEEYNKLKKKKLALDKEYKALLKEQTKIIELTKKADNLTHKKKQALQEKLNNNNKKIKEFNIKQKAFNEKVSAFNKKNQSSTAAEE